MATCKFKARKDESSRGAGRYAQVSSYGLDSTTNLDALRVQRYKEVREERKEKKKKKKKKKKRRNTVQRSIATVTAASLARLAKIETSKGLEAASNPSQ